MARFKTRLRRDVIVSLLGTLAVVGLLGPGADAAAAQDEPAGREQSARPGPGDRSTPRAAVAGYLLACRDGEHEAAARHLDLRAGDADQGATLARQLKVVLDQHLWLDLSQISAASEGDPDDGLPDGVDQIGTLPSERGDVAVRLERRERDAGAPEWLFDASLVARIPRLYDEHGYGVLGEVLPSSFFEARFLEVDLWQWIGLLVLVLLASLAGLLAARLTLRLGGRFLQIEDADWDDALLEVMAGPLRLGLSVAAFYAGSFLLVLAVPAQTIVARLCQALAVVAVTWFVLRVVDIFAAMLLQKISRKDPTAAQTLVPMGKRVTKIFIVAVAVVSLVHNLGFNVAGLLAGLGVGGLAVALAAQKTLENLFGGFTIVADRPVKVGEFCKVGEHTGTVEDIGLRSTRIRTLDRTLLTIPNAELAGARIENYGRRDMMRLHTVLQFGYDTSPDQLRYLLVEVRKMLFAHSRTVRQPCRVRFVNFGAHSLDMEVFVFVATRDWNEFLGVREDIYLRIMDIVDGSGAYFAYPSQTLYLGRDGGRDPELTKRAEQTIAALREKGELPLPEFPAATIDALDDTLEFPPAGSAARG